MSQVTYISPERRKKNKLLQRCRGGGEMDRTKEISLIIFGQHCHGGKLVDT